MALDLQNTIDTEVAKNSGYAYAMGTNVPKEAVETTTPVSTDPMKEVSAISSKQGEDLVKQSRDTLTQLQTDREDKLKLLEDYKKRRDELQKQLDARRQQEDELSDVEITVNEEGEEVVQNKSPEQIAVEREKKQAEDSLMEIMEELEDQAISSRELRNTFDSIRKVYSARVKRMEDINQRRQDALRSVGVRLGSRYTGGTQGGIFGGVIAEEERQGLERINTIEAEMESEIQRAEEAARNFNFQVYKDAADRAKKLYDEKRVAALELEKLAREEQEKVEEEEDRVTRQAAIVEQIGLGIKDPTEIFTALEGQVPFDVIKEITDTLPGQEDTEFKFISGSKYQPAGYFDPTTGAFTKIDAQVAGDGTTEINGNSVGFITPGMSDTDIDSLNISDSAKAYVKLWKDGRMTQEDILQRLSGDKTDRKLRNEVIGVIAQMQTPEDEVNESISTYNRNKANNAIDNVDTALDLLKGAAAGAKGRAFFGEAEGGPMGIGGFLGAGGANATFVAAIDSLKGMIAFGELQTMRDNSPTGGALGQVTERELDLLASQIASLDIRQEDKQLKENLDKIKKSFARVRAINSPNTTPEEYKKQFPDASKQELDELKARIDAQNNARAPRMSNEELMNTAVGNPPQDDLSNMELFDSIGLD